MYNYIKSFFNINKPTLIPIKTPWVGGNQQELDDILPKYNGRGIFTIEDGEEIALLFFASHDDFLHFFTSLYSSKSPQIYDGNDGYIYLIP